MSELSKERINEKLSLLYQFIPEDKLMALAKADGALNNVFTGLNEECLGLIGEQTGFNKKIYLFYLKAGPGALRADALELDLEDPDRNHLVLGYSKQLCLGYDHLDLIDLFNALQHKIKTYVELHGYRAFDSGLANEWEGMDFLLMVPNEKGIFFVPTLQKLSFYRQFFGNIHLGEKPADLNTVYLLLNLDNSHVKIGRSKQINHRERTLQSQEPAIELIAFWLAPKGMETKLHAMFRHKNLRGEWFKLNFNDLKKIKDLMA